MEVALPARCRACPGERGAAAFQAQFEGQSARAREILESGFLGNPNEEIAWGRAMLGKSLQEPDTWREKALGLRPRFARALYDRGVARKAKGDLDGAIVDYTRAIEIDPKRAQAYVDRANARKARGDLDEAPRQVDPRTPCPCMGGRAVCCGAARGSAAWCEARGAGRSRAVQDAAARGFPPHGVPQWPRPSACGRG